MSKRKNYPNIKVGSEEIDYYNKEFNNNEEIRDKEKALRKLFNVNVLKDDRDICNVLNKGNNINSFYSTRIKDKDFHKVCKHISQNIDNINDRIKKGDLSVVNDMAKVSGSDGIYSFSSKYCHFSNPEKFSIYDSYVHNMLYALQQHENFYVEFYKGKEPNIKPFTHKDLQDYMIFEKVMFAFRNSSKWDLSKYNRIEIDKFLWTAGKNKYFKPGK